MHPYVRRTNRDPVPAQHSQHSYKFWLHFARSFAAHSKHSALTPIPMLYMVVSSRRTRTVCIVYISTLYDYHTFKKTVGRLEPGNEMSLFRRPSSNIHVPYMNERLQSPSIDCIFNRCVCLYEYESISRLINFTLSDGDGDGDGV